MIESFRLEMLKCSLKGQSERNEALKKNFLDFLNTRSLKVTAQELLDISRSVEEVIPVQPWYCPPRNSNMQDFLFMERYSTITCDNVFEAALDVDINNNPTLSLSDRVSNFPTLVQMIKLFVDKEFTSGFIYDW